MSTSTSLRRTIQNRTVQGFIDASWLSRRRQELRALRYEADWLTRNLGDGSRLLHGTGFGMVAAPCYNGAVDRNLPLDTTIRPARDEDVEAMRQIEREAGGLFAQIGMDDIADDEPLPTDVLLSYVAGER